MVETDSTSRHTPKLEVLSWLTAALCLLGCLYYFFFFFSRAFVEVEIEVEQQSQLKIYWAGENDPFTEKKRSSVRVSPGGIKSYGFFLTDLADIDRLRIDPMQYRGTATIRRITISQTGFETIHVSLETLQPAHEIAAQQMSDKGLVVESSGGDPYFVFRPSPQSTSVNWGIEFARYFFICLLIVLLIWGCASFRHNFAFVPVLLSVVLGLIVTMAAVSKRNAHPDEYVHLQATAYYQDHWLPPQVDSKEIENTYSAYGISRLNNGEIYYLLAGKFSRLVEIFQINELFSLRLFNIMLFALITGYAFYSVHARFVALPFLLTPQLWYIFSYCVSDAFGLFICFLAGCGLVRPAGFVNCLFDELPAFRKIRAMLAMSLILAMLLLLKINYYPFIILFAAVIFFKWLKDTTIDKKAVFIRFSICIVLAMVLVGVRVGADYLVNGLDRQEKIAIMQEKTAHHWYKPSTELDKKHVSMYLKERGTSLKEMIVKHQWFRHNFVTGFGLYGYFTISAPEFYYRLVKWALIIFLVYTCTSLLIRGDNQVRGLTVLVVMLSVALIGASLYRSWTIDLQAQGRYLFPILPMVGILLARGRTVIDNGVFILFSIQLFALSLYSYIFIALIQIPRPG